MILRGDSGTGKSTFLDTIGLFRANVVTGRIAASDDIANSLAQLEPTSTPRIVVLEGREALGEVSAATLEAGLHAVNAFVRTPSGRNTLVVWPTNTDDLTERLLTLSRALGAEALFGVGQPVENFGGPSKDQFSAIAERTVAALNEGASLAALGLSADGARALVERAKTIGELMGLIRDGLITSTKMVSDLIPTETPRLWIVVIAGSEPDADVAALTRGGQALADVDRLMTSTGANIVQELKKHPDQLGILGGVLDARILNVDMLTILAVVRQYGDSQLHEKMRAAGMSIQSDEKAKDRLEASELGIILSGSSLGTRKRGSKPGGNTELAFSGLAGIASNDDISCNRALGKALVDTGLIEGFETERDLGTELVFKSDLYCLRGGEPIRLEIMWRTTTSRAAIANYVLGKLGNYGKAIGLLQ